MLTIGTFSKLSNVTTNTLRYYDEIGLIKPIHVNQENGYRYYDVDQLETILYIGKLKQYRFTLDEVAEAIHSMDDHILLAILEQKRFDIQRKLELDQYIFERLEKDILNMERGIPIMSYLNEIQVKLVETEAMNILSIRKKMNVKDYGKYINELFGKVTRENLTIIGAPMSIFHDEEYDPENYDMEIAIPVKEETGGTRVFPGQLCAKAILHGPYSDLPSIYAKMKQWVEEEKLVVEAPIFEQYLTDPRKEIKESEYMTEIYFPVKR